MKFLKGHIPTLTLIFAIFVQGFAVYSGLKTEISNVRVELTEVKTKLECHLQPNSCHYIPKKKDKTDFKLVDFVRR